MLRNALHSKIHMATAPRAEPGRRVIVLHDARIPDESNAVAKTPRYEPGPA